MGWDVIIHSSAGVLALILGGFMLADGTPWLVACFLPPDGNHVCECGCYLLVDRQLGERTFSGDDASFWDWARICGLPDRIYIGICSLVSSLCTFYL